MNRPHDKELAIPDAAVDDPHAREVIRIWLCGDGTFTVNTSKPLSIDELTDVLVSIAYVLKVPPKSQTYSA
jgi:hypothetical protein